ncbi:MAG: hypothetical protein KBF45_02490 [Cyclobacteriaceae bacterium]|jgi:hypothetical protein|nr:hypothetical protein [Cyclobacteriaceae bacterium]
MKELDATEKMTTLSEQVDKAVSMGYKENFRVVSGALTSAKASHPYKADQLVIANFYRFEGYSNPDDNSILYLIETHDGKKGTLIDSYGSTADANISHFVWQIEDIQKKNKSK